MAGLNGWRVVREGREDRCGWRAGKRGARRERRCWLSGCRVGEN
jgi:hypothetical protein